MFAVSPTIERDSQSSVISFPPRICVPRRLDEMTAESFFARCQDYVQQHQPTWLVLDFCDTVFVDSCGIGALTQLGKLAWKRKFRLIGWSVSSHVESLLQETGCDLYIRIDSRMTALQEDTAANSQRRFAHVSVNSATKRAVDIAGALVGLLVTVGQSN